MCGSDPFRILSGLAHHPDRFEETRRLRPGLGVPIGTVSSTGTGGGIGRLTNSFLSSQVG